jgi:hypothetical protein
MGISQHMTFKFKGQVETGVTQEAKYVQVHIFYIQNTCSTQSRRWIIVHETSPKTGDMLYRATAPTTVARVSVVRCLPLASFDLELHLAVQ